MSRYLLKSKDGRTLPISREVVKMGRGEENTMIVRDPAVSRHHLTFYIKDQKLVVEDAGSQNGYLLNGVRGPQVAILNHGDRVYVGSTEYKVVNELENIPTPSPQAFQGAARQGPGGFQAVTAQSVKVSSSNPIRMILIVGALLMGAMYFQNQKKPPTEPVAENDDSAVVSRLPGSSYKDSPYIPKGPTEISAEGRYQEGLRDYFNGRYSRAKLYFENALEIFPGHPGAASYLEKSKKALSDDTEQLLKDSQQSFDVGQYRRSKARAMEVLTLLSDDVFGFSRQVASEAQQNKDGSRAKGQEETVMGLPCDKTFLSEACKQAKELIKISRERLGEEDTLK